MNVTRCFGGVRLGPHAPEGVLWIQAERGRAECRMLATIWRRQTSRLKSGHAPSDLGGDRLRVRRIHGRGANCARDGSQSIGAGYGCGDRLKDLYNSQRYVRRLIPVSRRKVFEMSGQPSRKPPHAYPISEFERGELRAWATKHGMVIRNTTDERLVLPVWRKIQSGKRVFQMRNKLGGAAS
jgi:hypothetical protein